MPVATSGIAHRERAGGVALDTPIGAPRPGSASRGHAADADLVGAHDEEEPGEEEPGPVKAPSSARAAASSPELTTASTPTASTAASSSPPGKAGQRRPVTGESSEHEALVEERHRDAELVPLDARGAELRQGGAEHVDG